jgi:predicted metalloprotease with PDZ domain
MLDLRLLELSHGTRGLRDVLLQLAKKYGPDHPISEQNFFQDFTALTYPEIGDFFKRYVQGAEPLPLQQYLGRIGIRYEAAHHTGRQLASLGSVAYDRREDGSVFIKRPSPAMQAAGIVPGDELLAVGDVPVVGPAYAGLSKSRMAARTPGTDLGVRIRRGTAAPKEVPVKLTSAEEIQRYYFAPDPAATPEQLAARATWLRNL